LQERLQSLGQPLPAYRVLVETGPEHRKVFSVQVASGERVLSQGEGRTKKDAEQEAARLAIDQLDAGTDVQG
jgi:ribonuclease-3